MLEGKGRRCTRGGGGAIRDGVKTLNTKVITYLPKVLNTSRSPSSLPPSELEIIH